MGNMSIASPNLSGNMRRQLAEMTVRNLWNEYMCEIGESELIDLIANEERHIGLARRVGNVQEMARRESIAAKYRKDLRLLAQANLLLAPVSVLCPTCHNARHIPIVQSIDSGPYNRTWRDLILCPACMCEECGKLRSSCTCPSDYNEELSL